MYKTLEVLGPEHEFSIVDGDLHPLSIVDKVIRFLHGRVVNNVSLDGSSIGKELQSHVLEVKANQPFSSPRTFEETMQTGVSTVNDLLKKDFDAMLLGTGMHPLLHLDEAGIWTHRDRIIYDALAKIFNMRQHGWLNIQSFQLNLPYRNETEAINLHNALANILPYLPAIAASSPIFESKVGRFLDNRLNFYAINQKEVPSIVGNLIPEYVSSFEEYRRNVIERYTTDLRKAGAPKLLLNKEWLNSRGSMFRFDRRAIEIRVMDEQECVKADVALSCFIRCLLRGWLSSRKPLHPQEMLIQDLWSVVKDGLDAKVSYPNASNARQVCLEFMETAEANAANEEKGYLRLVKNRIQNGNLADLILRDVVGAAEVHNFHDAVMEVYLRLIKCLRDNTPY